MAFVVYKFISESKVNIFNEPMAYIGITQAENSGQEATHAAVNERYREHAHADTLFGKARKAGERFDYEILDTVATELDARIREHELIEEHGTLDPFGYNQRA